MLREVNQWQLLPPLQAIILQMHSPKARHGAHRHGGSRALWWLR